MGGLGFRGLGFRVWGLGFRGLGFGVLLPSKGMEKEMETRAWSLGTLGNLNFDFTALDMGQKIETTLPQTNMETHIVPF